MVGLRTIIATSIIAGTSAIASAAALPPALTPALHPGGMLYYSDDTVTPLTSGAYRRHEDIVFKIQTVSAQDFQYEASWNRSSNGGSPRHGGPATVKCTYDGRCADLGTTKAQRDMITYDLSIYGQPPLTLSSGTSWEFAIDPTSVRIGKGVVKVTSLADGVLDLTIDAQGTQLDSEQPAKPPTDTFKQHTTMQFRGGILVHEHIYDVLYLDNGVHQFITEETVALAKQTP